MAESNVQLKDPQYQSASKINDPTNVDDSFNYVYDTTTQFSVSNFTTFIQDAKNLTQPSKLPEDLVPSSSSFILQINGSNFKASPFSPNPFLIYANLDTYWTIIPPLSTATSLKLGHAFGYVVKDDSTIWIYFDRLLAQKIWFVPTSGTDTTDYTGEIEHNRVSIETSDSHYRYINTDIPQLTLYIIASVGDIQPQVGFFDAFNAVSKAITPITQTPYIVAMAAYSRGDHFFPITEAVDGKPQFSAHVFGHGLKNNHVMLVKTTSTLLQDNPSALPRDVLTQDQSNLTYDQIQALQFFKEGTFLGTLQDVGHIESFNDYDYLDANRKLVHGTANVYLPDADVIDGQSFIIKTMPPGQYYVVIYDDSSGLYAYAPDKLTIVASDTGFQIQKITPTASTLQNPTFTLSGYNFPAQDVITNGGTLEASLITEDNVVLATLLINKASPTHDVSGNGTISLASDTQMKVAFTNFNVNSFSGNIPNNVVNLQLTLTHAVGPNALQVIETETSPVITIQVQPVIEFFTNIEEAPPTSIQPLNSPVRIDQNTGQVIAFGEPGIYGLFIVGKNFGTAKDVSVLFNGEAQTIDLFKEWAPNPTLSLISVKTQANSNFKGNVNVEVKSAGVSSDPLILTPSPPIVMASSNVVFKSDKYYTKAQVDVSLGDLFSAIPQDLSYVPLNNGNTKIASSTKATISNTILQKKLELSGDLTKPVAIDFIPNQITIPADTQVQSNNVFNITFAFYGAFSVNYSSPKIVKLEHINGSATPTFKKNEQMIVIGNGFTIGMRYNINNSGWTAVDVVNAHTEGAIVYSSFTAIVPDSQGHAQASIKISNDQADTVSSVNTAGQQNGPYKYNTITVNDKYSPLLKINQRLPAGIKMYAKGPQVSMTDVIDANMSIYSQITPFLGAFKIILVVIRIIVCIIDVICALINPFQLIIAIIALMDCIIDLLSLFPQLAVPIMILSFIQNFVAFLQTFIVQVEAYVFSIVNSQLALVKSQLSKDFAQLAAAEQQAFAATKQMGDVIAFLEPPLQIVQIFKDLLQFAMHIPCAANHGGTQNNGQCPPPNIQSLINNADDQTDVEGIIEKIPGLKDIIGDPGFLAPPGLEDEGRDVGPTLATMFCQAVAIQTATVATIPGLTPGQSSVVPTISPTLPDIAATIECMTNLTNAIENNLNEGKTTITTAAQGQALTQQYLQCVQNLVDQTNQSLGDICGLAVSAINSELKVTPKGNIGPDFSDDFIRTKIALPNTDPNDQQDAGLVLDLAKLRTPQDLPTTITTDPVSGSIKADQNFGLKQDIYTPIIIQTTNKSGQRQSKDTIYFNAENADVGDLIVPGDILEIVGGVFNGLQFPILAIQKIFTAVRLTCKLNITAEQKLLVGEQPLPENLSGFDVKVIAHLAGNDAIAVVPADNVSLATIQVYARDHHGHLIGSGIANKVAVTIESGSAVFVPVIPSATTDITGVIQESGNFYIANLKSECAGTVIVSASVCNVEFVDIGYHSQDPTHAIVTRKKTIKILFTPPIPKPVLGGFTANVHPQVPGTHIDN